MATKYVTLKDSNGDTLYPQAVATNIVTTSGTLTGTPAHSWGTNNYTLQKLGNVVIFNCASIWQDGNTSAGTWYEIGTVPDGFIPSNEQAGAGCILDGNTGNIVSQTLLTINTSGKIRGKPLSAATTSLVGWQGIIVWTV